MHCAKSISSLIVIILTLELCKSDQGESKNVKQKYSSAIVDFFSILYLLSFILPFVDDLSYLPLSA